MNPSREELLFQLALTKRVAWLDRECGDDAALRARLEALLAAHEQSVTALDAPTAPARPTVKLDFADAPDDAVGQTIGRYKLLEKIGEGGCGVVYVAEQTEPVRRRVALKVIKLGMDTKQVVARFEAERQALAMMDHPNIAKVLDAGTTETPVAAGVSPAVEPGFQSGGFRSADHVEDVEAAPGALGECALPEVWIVHRRTGGLFQPAAGRIRAKARRTRSVGAWAHAISRRLEAARHGSQDGRR